MVAFIGSTLLLVGTWSFSFMWIAAATEGWLVPWDCVCAPLRPPLGTWERAVNDFFEALPGAILPSVVVILVSTSIFVARITRRTANMVLLPLAFAATNIAFFLADAFLVSLAHQLLDLWLPQPRPPIDVGYHRTWPAISVTTVLVIILFVVQSVIGKPKSQHL